MFSIPFKNIIKMPKQRDKNKNVKSVEINKQIAIRIEKHRKQAEKNKIWKETQ